MLPPHTWIRDAQSLLELAKKLADAPWVALDTESNSMFVYRERVCLIQLRIEDSLFLIDPLALPPGPEALAPLAPALSSPQQDCYLHGGEYDVAVLKREFDLPLRGVFDSQIAASFLGWPRTGYANVVEEICGVRLPKGFAQYDWGTRPIESEALRYALEDVIHLPEVVTALRKLVSEADLEEELSLANLTVEGVAPHRVANDPARIYKLKGVRDLPKSQLPLLLSLYQWRDRKGNELDLPPGRILANDQLVFLARRAPTSKRQFDGLRLRGRLVRAHKDELWACMEASYREPPELPSIAKRERPSPDRQARENRLKKWRREESERRKVPLQVVLPSRVLEKLKSEETPSLASYPELGTKRIALYGEALLRLCAG